MRVQYSLAIVLLVVFADSLDWSSALAEPPGADMGPPNADFFMHESRARDTSRDDNWESKSTPDLFAYVPMIAALATVAFLAYFARRESKT